MAHNDGQRQVRSTKPVQHGDERRQRIKSKYRNKQYDVTVIEATKAVLQPDEEPAKKRVCAYCRVSTDDDAQLSSYELQVQYYQEYINAHPDWELTEIYADEGISGTSTKKRESFMRMIRDCEAGKIDYIVTKSISRFARNVLDCLTYVRKLKNLPQRIGVYFEKERMDTLDDKSEFTLSVLSSIAQEESRSISTNISWAIKRRFERGIPLCPTGLLLGYDTDENGEMFIVRSEAEIVRMIFERYIAGMSFKDIAEMLNQLGYKTIKGNNWVESSVRGILTNEKYCGDVINQKTFTEDYLTHRSVKNTGQREKYYIRDHHEPIVTRETYDEAQGMIGLRGGHRKLLFHQKRLFVKRSGILCGFVPFAKGWKAVAYGRVVAASKRAMDSKPKINKEELTMATDIMKGFEVIDIEKANSQATVTVARTKLRFNKATAHELQYPEYVVMSLNPTTRQVAVQGSTKATQNAFPFAEKGEETRYSIIVNIMALANTIRKMMGWADDAEYTAHGVYYAAADAIIFEMDTALRSEKRRRQKKVDAVPAAAVQEETPEVEASDKSEEEKTVPASTADEATIPEPLPVKRRPGRPRKNV
jgi:DNA invertase Pin-like site-specific DNA recombinase